ncbi:protein abrupt-like isoform X2 [Cherax quadricarinatus]|uniref:protein abrupt-like isoform X2 n=1 Tax=Cherax quadricarinatus TaxID=27406 RepID=UPI00387EC7F7
MKEEDDLQLILTWRDHKQVLTLVMETLHYKELFADVTLICGEKQYAVHKFVLCTCSPYFEELLECVPCEHPVLVLTETSHETLEELLDFMYLGQTDFCSKDLDRLLDLAYEFRIKGLISPKDEADRQELKKDSVQQELSKVITDDTKSSKGLKRNSVKQEPSEVMSDKSTHSEMQGGGVNIIEVEENLKAFQNKLLLWKCRTENDNFANFSLLDDCASEIEDMSGIGDISVPGELKQAIAMHLDELAKFLDGYFPTRVISRMGETAVHIQCCSSRCQ